MDYGVVLPHLGTYARENVVQRVRIVAQQAEALGFNSLWVGDHLIVPTKLNSKYPYHPEGRFPLDPADNFLEPFTVLSYVAGQTTTIRLGTGVLIIPYRNPVVTAKMYATLDVLSGGRTIVGAGVGWMEEEFDILHAPYHERGVQTDEYLQAMKVLWTEQEPQFEGRYEKFADIRCEPKPVQKPHPPIWIGGHSKAALRRTATIADGWYGHALWRNPDALPCEIQTIRRLAEQAGRDPDALTYAALAYEQTPGDVLRALPRYQQAGLDHVVLAFFMWTQNFDDMLQLMERFAKEVGLTKA